MKNYLLILAGGKGNRLWPISKNNMPKQFLNLYGNEIMINETIRRVEEIFKYKNIFIVVNKEQKELAGRYIDSRIPRQNIICEPEMKNTAMCIFLATIKIKKMKGDGVISVLSSDHYIEEKEKLQDDILNAIELAKKNVNLVTIGITPTYPATGFGYIKYEKENEDDNYYSVIEFKEKPCYEKAIEFLNNNYLWNSGMFVWKIETILENFRKYLPDIYKYSSQLYNCISTDTEENIIRQIYKQIEPVSIDKGILEKSKNIKMIKSNFKWMDLGSIKNFFEIQTKDNNSNIIIGDSIIENTTESHIYNATKDLLLVVDVNNLSIIKTDNVCIICNNESVNEIPRIRGYIEKEENYQKFI